MDGTTNKLVIAIVPDDVADRVLPFLVERRIGVTTLTSVGGFHPERGRKILLSGVPDAQVDEVAQLIQTKGKRDDGVIYGVVFAIDTPYWLSLEDGALNDPRPR